MTKLRKATALLAAGIAVIGLAGCSNATVVNHNLRNEAREMNILRRVSVINLRSNTPVLEITGWCNINTDADGDLNVTCRKAEDAYSLHYANLTSPEVIYVVEQLDGQGVDPYHFEFKIMPSALNPLFGVYEQDDFTRFGGQ